MQQSQCKKPRNKDPRNIIINAKLSKKKQKPSFINNKIKTAKYNFVDFIPKCIFLQFMRLVNFYFLAVAVMQCIDEIASLAPFSAIAPLGFVLVVSLIREAFDDIKRHKNDKEINQQLTQFYKFNQQEKQFELKDIK